MTKYELYLQITRDIDALLEAGWATVAALGQKDFPYGRIGGGPALLESLMRGNDLRITWEEKIARDPHRAAKLLFADYLTQRDALMTLLRETV